MAFHDVKLSDEIEQGAQGGLNFYTTVISATAGQEQRNEQWQDDRGEWDISYGMRRKEHIDEVRNFIFARRGAAHSFRFRDWGDYTAVETFIGTGDGIVDDIGFAGHRAGTRDFQLIKRYPDTVNPYDRQIYKPVIDGTYHVYVEGVEKVVTQQGDGVFRFLNADLPLVGDEITASFYFDIPVRFGNDKVIQQLSGSPLTSALPSIKVIGVRPPNY